MRVQLIVNGVSVDDDVEPRLTLADLLRDRQQLTGTHLGCEHGICGACTVQVDGEPARSCLMFAVQADGREVTTVEGLAGGDDAPLHPLQDAFHEHHALQCGFCTPGFLMSIEPLLPDIPGMDDEQLRGRLSGNLCRCTGYGQIVAASRETAEAGAQTRLLAASAPAPGIDWERALDVEALRAGAAERAPGWELRLALLDRDDERRVAHLQADARRHDGPGRVRAGVELSLDDGTVAARVSARSFAAPGPADAGTLDELLAQCLAAAVTRIGAGAAPTGSELAVTPADESRRAHGALRSAVAAAAVAAGIGAAALAARALTRRRS
jgi:aerobic carbon-monoxide dehydrogenase small subunit